MKTNMNIKVDEEVRDEAKELFGKLGLDMTTAINLFLRASIREKGIPFPIMEKTNFLQPQELDLVKKIFTAYEIAYVADFIVSILAFIRIIIKIIAMILKSSLNK